MKKTPRIKQLLAAILALVMLCLPGATVSAAYPTADMFAGSDSIKGLQGASARTQGSYGGLQHSLVSAFLDECIYEPSHEWVQKGFIAPYEFEGETFYFGLPNAFNFAKNCNGCNMSISVVFLMRWDGGGDRAYLIDENSREPGHLYYAPATTGTGGKTMRAFWQYLMENLAAESVHIDNFILGNEVNMPNSWHYSGGSDPNAVAVKYADAFYAMYSTVKKFTNVFRCSISVDHSWQNNDGGNGIAVKDFLHIFNDRLAQHEQNVEWCISAHLYPAMLYNTRIWEEPEGLNPRNSSARIVDGRNLSVMTNYIKETFGEQHRIMLTEQGFTRECGPEAQAACLAYTYYAAMYDPMVDSFLINTENAGYAAGGQSLDFNIEGTLAEQVYTKIDNGNAQDQQWIADTCLPVIGVSSWEEIIPNFGSFTRGKNGFYIEDGRGRLYEDGNINTSYSGWYLYNDNRYLLIRGEEAELPTRIDNGYTGWYKNENTVLWSDAGCTAYNKKIYDSSTDAWYLLDNGGNVVFGGYEIDGIMHKCNESTGVYEGVADLVWCSFNGKDYWYENGIRQGYDPNNAFYRGKEIYDPASNAWYWLDNVQQGAKAVSKDVYQESDAGAWAENKENGTGKWVRYDQNGLMIKGWSYTENGTYYFDPIYGTMAKGTVEIEGTTFTFDEATGIMK